MNVITAADAARRTKIMKHFTINQENNITLHASRREAKETDGSLFSTEAQFADVIGNDNQRLLEIWNGLPGVKPVTKFANRKVATERIWRAIQGLGGVASQGAHQEPETPATPFDEPVVTVGAQAADVAPAKAEATKKATRSKKAPAAATNASVPREGSKTSQVIAMLKREGGATLEEIMTAMGWQQHTTRALMSAGGSLRKKHGLVVTSKKVGDKRTYFIKG
jgi:Protein of unknown function (DUF3489)